MARLSLRRKEEDDQDDHGAAPNLDSAPIDSSQDENKLAARKGRPRISVVSQRISTVGVDSFPKTTVKLSDKLETPEARQKKSSASHEKTFSLVNNESISNKDISIRQNTCIVCLKINKTLFQQIFKSPDGSKGTSFKGNSFDSFTPDESVSNISTEMQMELSQDKTLNIPDIYSTTELDIQPEKIHFKQYSDIDEECLNRKLNQGLNDKKTHLILASFKNKSWPNSSPYACWNCTENFEGAPVGIPTIAMADSYEDKYYLEGNFCSFNCAARYLFDTNPNSDNQLWTIYEIMNFIFNEINDSDDYQKIKLAPERICLKKFGGHLTLEEYRKNHLAKVNYEVFRSPLIPALYHIQENMDLNRLIKNTNRK